MVGRGENTKAAQNEQSQAEITTKVAKALREALPMLMAKLHGSGVGPTAEYKSTGTVTEYNIQKMLERCKLPRWNDFFLDIPSAERRPITESELKKFVGLPVSKAVAYFIASESTIRAHAKRCKIKLGSKDSTSDSLSVVDKVHEGPRVEEGKKEMKRKACDMLRFKVQCENEWSEIFMLEEEVSFQVVENKSGRTI
ncbi:hypothetical protein R6Q59_001916 [Mikania micrantha]